MKVFEGMARHAKVCARFNSTLRHTHAAETAKQAAQQLDGTDRELSGDGAVELARQGAER
jgi:hypothetical protein